MRIYITISIILFVFINIEKSVATAMNQHDGDPTICSEIRNQRQFNRSEPDVQYNCLCSPTVKSLDRIIYFINEGMLVGAVAGTGLTFIAEGMFVRALLADSSELRESARNVITGFSDSPEFPTKEHSNVALVIFAISGAAFLLCSGTFLTLAVGTSIGGAIGASIGGIIGTIVVVMDR